MTDWQPIETAPKDGTNFLAYWPLQFAGANSWDICRTWFEFDFWKTAYFISKKAPTHWMPLPEPPKNGE